MAQVIFAQLTASAVFVVIAALWQNQPLPWVLFLLFCAGTGGWQWGHVHSCETPR